MLDTFPPGVPVIRCAKLSVLTAALLSALLLAACGGGSDAKSAAAAPVIASPPTVLDPGAPQSTNDVATDGFNWFNYRRVQMGLAATARNNLIDVAALGHSNYQKANNVTSHVQIIDKLAFTGVQVDDRLTAAGYQFTQGSYAFGEVVSSTGTITGPDAAEGLLAAIYHRFVIFDPSFREAGAGVAVSPNGYTYFTTNFTVNGLKPGLGTGKFANYPFVDQQRVPVIFYSDFESPDPVSDRNEVGYPISVHADITSAVEVQTFTVRPRNGALLTTQLLTNKVDRNTPSSAASIIPINILAPATIYDVQFIGTVDGIAASRTWSFTTR